MYKIVSKNKPLIQKNTGLEGVKRYIKGEDKTFDMFEDIIDNSLTCLLFASVLCPTVATGVATSPTLLAVSSLVTLSGEKLSTVLKKKLSSIFNHKLYEQRKIDNLLRYKYSESILARLAVKQAFELLLKDKERFVILYKLDKEETHEIIRLSEERDLSREQHFIMKYRESEGFNKEEYWNRLVDDVLDIFSKKYSVIQGSFDKLKNELIGITREIYCIFQADCRSINGYKEWLDAETSDLVRDISGILLKNKIKESTIDRSYEMYKSKLSRRIKESNIHIDDSYNIPTRLDIEWKKFIQADTWGIGLYQKLNKIPLCDDDELNTVIKKIINVKDDIYLESYANINAFLGERINEFWKVYNRLIIIEEEQRWWSVISVKQSIFDLEEYLNQGYGRLFLITGESGSGKSHFYWKFLLENDKCYYIYIYNFEYENNIEKWILKGINSAFNVECSKLSDLDSQITINKKIVLIINDVNDIVAKDTNFFEKFLSLIDLLTKCKWGYIAIATPFFSIYRVMRYANEMSKYLHFATDTTDFQNIGGWLKLDYINYIDQVGLKIVESGSCLVNDDNKKLNRALCELNWYRNPLNRPYTSWRVVECKEILSDKNVLLTLNNFEFLNKYLLFKINEVIQNHNIEEYVFKNLLNRVTEFIIEQDEVCFTRRKLDKFLKNKAENGENSGDEVIERNEKREFLLNVLLKVGLLKYVENSSEKMALDFVNLWSLNLLNYYENKKTDKEIVMKCVYWIKENNFDLGKDLLELYFLKLEKTDFNTAEAIIKLLADEEIMSSIFLIAPQLSEKLQKVVLTYIKKNMYKLVDGYDVFSYMYFISNCSDNICELNKKCKYLMYNQYLIFKFDLDEILIYEVNRIIRLADNVEALNLLFVHFIQLEKESVSKRIGKMFSDRFLELSRDKSLEYTVKDLKFIIEQGVSRIEKRLKLKVAGDTIIEVFLSNVLCQLIKKDGYKVHNALYKIKWYAYNRHKETSKIMKRVVTVNYGKYLRSNQCDERIENHKKVVIDLINKRRNSLKILAFHFIRNSVLSDNKIVNKQFRAELELLYQDEGIKCFVDSVRDFFEANLH